jgi:prepilin-type N-terminal cleavage/methylation domain-containing protein
MNKKGFTLIELLIVVAIIGIIAAIAIPNLLVALQKGKQKATMGDLKSIGTGIESYITDWAVAPASDPVANGGETWFEPFYIKIAPQADGWGRPWGYEGQTTNADEYSIWSGGRGSGAPGAYALPSAGAQYICTALADFSWDIVFSNGNYTIGPDVKR